MDRSSEQEGTAWVPPDLVSRDGYPLAWYLASDDGNLEEGWVVLVPEKDGTLSATLCTYYEPK